MQWQVTPGVIDQHAVRAFTLGACGGLAVALHDATGWPIVTVGSCGGPDLHYMVRRPDGQLVDVEGLHTDADVTMEYEVDVDGGAVTMTETTREQVWAWYRDEAGLPVAMDVVRSIARAVLGRHVVTAPAPAVDVAACRAEAALDRAYWDDVYADAPDDSDDHDD